MAELGWAGLSVWISRERKVGVFFRPTLWLLLYENLEFFWLRCVGVAVSAIFMLMNVLDWVKWKFM